MHNIIPGMFIALIRDIHYIMLNLRGIFGFIKNRNCFCVSVRMRLLSEIALSIGLHTQGPSS